MRRILLIGSFLVLLMPVEAHAQSKRDRQVADGHFKNGVSLYREGKHREALAEFERANELAPHPLVLYNIAITYRAMSQYDQALHYLERFRDEGKKVGKKQLERGLQELAELEALVARVEVTTEPAGAQIAVADQHKGVTPLPTELILGPGRHVISATLTGYQPAKREVQLASGDRVKVVIQMSAVPAPVESLTVKPEPAPEPERSRGLGWLGLSAGFGTNARAVADTGAPIIGGAVNIGSRLSLSVDGVLVAYALIPSVRVRLFGDRLSVHAQGSVPVAFRDGEMKETFTAVSGGLALRYRMMSWSSLRLEGTVAYSGSERPVTVPVIAATEFWF